ncbi:glycosyltransferase family 1 protein [Mycolicibacterium moriokaense]|nr:glycosyltransferase family 1 protein [Mycolicibacterium moriokaense]
MKIAFVGNFGVSYSSENHHANSLEALGHQVIRLQEGHNNADTVVEQGMLSDLLVWVHTHGWSTPDGSAYGRDAILPKLAERGIPTLTYHLDLWFGLKRQQDLDTDSFYRTIGHFFTVDKLMADWFNKNTNVKGHYLPAAVYDAECYINQNPSSNGNDVIFVGSRGYHPEWPYRPQLVDWLRTTYGSRFTHVGGDGQVKTTRGDDLNRLYASSKIAVGDTLCIGFDYPYYWSDRVYETLGRGGFMIHPRIKGMDEHFTDREHLVFYDYGDFDQLKYLIDYYLVHDDERERIRSAGQQHVKDHHTYRHRWQTILDTIGGES